MRKTEFPSTEDQIKSLGEATVLLALKIGNLQERLTNLETVCLCSQMDRERIGKEQIQPRRRPPWEKPA